MGRPRGLRRDRPELERERHPLPGDDRPLEFSTGHALDRVEFVVGVVRVVVGDDDVGHFRGGAAGVLEEPEDGERDLVRRLLAVRTDAPVLCQGE